MYENIEEEFYFRNSNLNIDLANKKKKKELEFSEVFLKKNQIKINNFYRI